MSNRNLFLTVLWMLPSCGSPGGLAAVGPAPKQPPLTLQVIAVMSSRHCIVGVLSSSFLFPLKKKQVGSPQWHDTAPLEPQCPHLPSGGAGCHLEICKVASGAALHRSKRCTAPPVLKGHLEVQKVAPWSGFAPFQAVHSSSDTPRRLKPLGIMQSLSRQQQG